MTVFHPGVMTNFSQPAAIGAIEQAVNGERLLGWLGLQDPEAAEQRKIFAAHLAGVDGEGAGRQAEDLPGTYRPEVRCAEEIQEIFEDVRFLKLPEGAESGKVRLRGRFRRAGGRLELEGIGGVRDLDRLRALDRVNVNGIGIEGAGGMVRLKRERHPVLGPNRLVLLVEDRAVILVERQVCQRFVRRAFRTAYRACRPARGQSRQANPRRMAWGARFP